VQTADDFPAGSHYYYALTERPAHTFVTDIPAGVTLGSRRPAQPGHYLWRIMHFFFPFFTMNPLPPLGTEKRFVCRVPMDDEHTLQFFVRAVDSAQELQSVQAYLQKDFAGAGHLPNTPDWFGRARTVANGSNDFLLDRDLQRTDRGIPGFSGVTGILNQDGMATWSMGPVYDRTQEHLGSTDGMIIRVRRRLLEAARALAEDGTVPPGVDQPEAYRLRAGSIVLPAEADWIEATAEGQRAFPDVPVHA
jgi:hypothetical protein